MITYTTKKCVKFGENPKYYAEGECTSLDDKPTDLANGSKLLEMDTATMYVYDEENETWRAWV